MTDTKQTVTTSRQWVVNLKDALQAAEIAAVGAVMDLIGVSVNAGSLNFNWQQMGKAGLLAGLASLWYSFKSKSKTIIVPSVTQPVVVTPDAPAEDGKVIPLPTDDPKK